MDTMVETRDAVLEKTIFIAAAPERVWDFWTKKAYLDRWWQVAEADLAPDAAYALVNKAGERIVWGRVTRWERAERLDFTFEVTPLEGRETYVSLRFEAVPGGTRLHLTHRGIMGYDGPEVPVFAHLDAGWDEHFASLRALAG